jgi:hypothetical protein
MTKLCTRIARKLEWEGNPVYLVNDKPVQLNNYALAIFGTPLKAAKELFGKNVQIFAPFTNPIHLEFVEKEVLKQAGEDDEVYITAIFNGENYTYRFWENGNAIIEVSSKWSAVSRLYACILFMERNSGLDCEYYKRFFSIEDGEIQASVTVTPAQYFS